MFYTFSFKDMIFTSYADYKLYNNGLQNNVYIQLY